MASNTDNNPKFTCKKYVCVNGDLNKFMNDELKFKFWGLFYDVKDGKRTPSKRAWRMFWNGNTPEKFFARLGCDFNSPTVRMGVAFDLIKLDDVSVSNDREYTFREYEQYSIEECERLCLNRNFRINLVNLAPEWTILHYTKQLDEEKKLSRKRKRTMDRMYQGVRLSKTVLGYFNSIFQNGFDQNGDFIKEFDFEKDIYLPFTNGNDLTTEISLIANTHPDFSYVSARAYYDGKYIDYKKLLEQYGIELISSFALVDPSNDKNHTGEYMLKIQGEARNGKYPYIVVRMDKDGHICRRGGGELDVTVFSTENNVMLCVNENDINSDNFSQVVNGDNIWNPYETDETGAYKGIRDIPMVKSTTSSHYSIFRQRIPDYDLKYVRNYLQFKNRLAGMELCLEQLNRDIERKEIQCSECFEKETSSIWELFKEFLKNKDIMELQVKLYDLVEEYAELSTKKVNISYVLNEKNSKLKTLIDEYNSCDDTRLDRKIELGQIIKTLKLEIDKDFTKSLENLEKELNRNIELQDKIREEIRRKIDEQEKPFKPDEKVWNRFKDMFNDKFERKSDSTSSELEEKWDKGVRREHLEHNVEIHTHKDEKQSGMENLIGEKSIDMHVAGTSAQYANDKFDENADNLINKYPRNGKLTDEREIDCSNGICDFQCHHSNGDDMKTCNVCLPTNHLRTDELSDSKLLDSKDLKSAVRETEKWRGYMFSLGYELHCLKEMKTPAEDATIKVRRLVHNFEERMAQVENDVWNPMPDPSDVEEFEKWRKYRKYKFKDGFNFNGITSAGLRDIILLYDWYACNAPNKTWQEMHFDSEDEFKHFMKECNKTSMSLRKHQYRDLLVGKRIRLQDLVVELKNKLHSKDKLKYLDKYGSEAKKDEEKPWSIDDVSSDQVKKINVFTKAFDDLKDAIESRIANFSIKGMIKRDSELFKPYEEANKEVLEDEKNKPKDFDIKGTIKTNGELFNPYDEAYHKVLEDEKTRPKDFDIKGTIRTNSNVFNPYERASNQIAMDKMVKSQYDRDSKLMKERTIAYLQKIGLIEDESDLNSLALRSRILKHNDNVDVVKELEQISSLKNELDGAIDKMQSHRNTIRHIMDKVIDIEQKVKELKDKNKKIFNLCMYEKNRIVRNKLLLVKLDNETKVVELQNVAKRVKDDNLVDFSTLESLRSKVDDAQRNYDAKVESFKKTIGMNEDVISQLMISIYNKYQDEILELSQEVK